MNWEIIAAILGVLGVQQLILRVVDRRTIRLGELQTSQSTTAVEVQTIRDVLAEVRQQSAEKDTRLAAQEARVDMLEQRIDAMEKRERELLTKVAVHSGWDQLTYQKMIEHDPKHPLYPPLT